MGRVIGHETKDFHEAREWILPEERPRDHHCKYGDDPIKKEWSEKASDLPSSLPESIGKDKQSRQRTEHTDGGCNSEKDRRDNYASESLFVCDCFIG